MNQSLAQKTFRNILVIKPSSLGDVVRCLPILDGLRHRYPDARLAWLIRSDCAAVLHHQPRLTLLPFDRRHLGRASRSLRVGVDLLRFLNSLRRQNFDLVIDLQGLFRSAMFALAGAPIRLGFAHAREFAACFYTHRVAIAHTPEHVVESYWRFADALGFGQLPKHFALQISSDARQGAQKLLAFHGFKSGEPYVVLLIGGTAPEKRWAPERFAQLAHTLHKQAGVTCILLGAGHDERRAADQVLMHMHNRAIDLVDRTTLPQAFALLKDARCVIGNDTGPLHVAAALGTPLVGLYGPTDPAIVGPYGQLDGVVAPGGDIPRTSRYSRRPEHQMDRISVEEVLETLQVRHGALLAGGPGA